jgi:hypothetical protein
MNSEYPHQPSFCPQMTQIDADPLKKKDYLPYLSDLRDN